MGLAQDLEINRETRTVPYSMPPSGPEGWVKQEDGLYRAEFPLMPDFNSCFPSPEYETKLNAQTLKVFKDAGIKFGKGASVRYSGLTRKLVVTNTRKQLERTLSYVEEFIDDPTRRQLAIRTEIYELTKLQVLQLLESSAAGIDHTPERHAALRAVREGHAKLIASNMLVTTSGQRAKVSDTGQVKVPTKKLLQQGGQSKLIQDERGFGTDLEVEPILDNYENTIHLNIALEHHTEEPERTVNGPRLFPKVIQTCVTLGDGAYLILGNWSPGGGESSLIAFVTVSVQVVN